MDSSISDGKIEYSTLANFSSSDILYMLKDLPDACCIFKVLTDPFGTVKDMLFLFANEKYSKMVGVPSAELVGNTYFSTVSNRDEDWIKFSYQAAILRQSSIMRTYNSTYDKWFEFWAVPVYHKGFCAFIIHDVTAIKKNEEDVTLRRNTNKLVIDCATALSSAEFGKGIKKVLKILGETIDADRVYIVQTQDSQISEFNEWMKSSRNANLPPRKTLVEYNVPACWKAQMGDKDVVDIPDTSVILEHDEKIYNSLLAGTISRYVVAKLKDKQNLLGYLVADNYGNDKQLNVSEAVESVAVFIAAEMRNRALTNEMIYLGSHDALTGMGNRYALNQALIILSEMSVNVGVCYSDINGLKLINDEEGHQAGDERIKETAEIFSAVFKEKFCYRIGGDEFIAIVPEIEEQKFDALVEKLKVKTKKLSLSVGAIWAKDSKDIKKIVKMADEAMYESKAEYYKSHERRHKS